MKHSFMRRNPYVNNVVNTRAYFDIFSLFHVKSSTPLQHMLAPPVKVLFFEKNNLASVINELTGVCQRL